MKRKITEAQRLANKYNQRLRRYYEKFDKSFPVDMINREVKVFWTPGSYLSASTFSGDSFEVEGIIQMLDRIIAPVGTKVKEVRKEIKDAWSASGKQGPANISLENVEKEIRSKATVMDKFDDLKERFYSYEASRTFGMNLMTDKDLELAHRLLYHKHKWESYSQMLQAVDVIDRVLVKYGW